MMTTISALGSGIGVFASASTKEATKPVSSTAEAVSTSETASASASLKEETAKFRKLVEVAIDTTGRYSLDERLAAYTAALKTSLVNPFAAKGDSGAEGRALIDQLWDGPIAKRANEVYENITGKMASRPGGLSAPVAEYLIEETEKELNLSGDDLKIFFAGNINIPNSFRNYERPYTSIEEWHADLRRQLPGLQRWAEYEKNHPADPRDIKPWVPGGSEASETVTTTAATTPTSTSASTTTSSKETPAESLARGARAITPVAAGSTWQTGLLQLFDHDASRAGFATKVTEQRRWFDPYRAVDRTGLRQERLA